MESVHRRTRQAGESEGESKGGPGSPAEAERLLPRALLPAQEAPDEHESDSVKNPIL